tara:strand:+ start:1863 stop:2087 length:225 start_codon:yes stop_codon:yes gene_type:complete
MEAQKSKYDDWVVLNSCVGCFTCCGFIPWVAAEAAHSVGLAASADTNNLPALSNLRIEREVFQQQQHQQLKESV